MADYKKLLVALEAWPSKELIAGYFITMSGLRCAAGACNPHTRGSQVRNRAYAEFGVDDADMAALTGANDGYMNPDCATANNHGHNSCADCRKARYRHMVGWLRAKAESQ